MPFEATAYRVMIASPSDVRTEREIVRTVIHEWNAAHSWTRRIVLLPVAWETHSTPSIGERPQEIINRQVLKDCDLLVAVFWTRIGTSTGEYDSGTVEELERHIAEGRPALLYFSNQPAMPDSIDQEQYAALRDFKNHMQKKGLVNSYDSVEKFRDGLRQHLTITLNGPEFLKTVAQPPTESILPPRISDDGLELLRTAAAGDGEILRAEMMSGTIIQAGGRQFIVEGNQRSEARWREAIEDLLDAGAIVSVGSKNEVFRVTAAGYKIVDES